MAQECRHLRMTGLVQGVAYRAWTRGQAEKLGLTGWVRNEHDGSVTALVCGEKSAVEAMVTACWQGPGAAEVRDVQAEVVPVEVFEGFEIRR